MPIGKNERACDTGFQWYRLIEQIKLPVINKIVNNITINNISFKKFIFTSNIVTRKGFKNNRNILPENVDLISITSIISTTINYNTEKTQDYKYIYQ